MSSQSEPIYLITGVTGATGGALARELLKGLNPGALWSGAKAL